MVMKATITFLVSVAMTAQMAIKDCREYNNMDQTATNVYETPECEDIEELEDYLYNLVEYLAEWGIEKDDFEIH